MPPRCTVFVHLRGATASGADWRLGPQHALALVAYSARQWGPVVQCYFPRGMGRLLGYGTITFRDKDSVTRMLHAAHERNGVLRIPYASRPERPDEIAYTSLADARRAWATGPSVLDAVHASAPLASGARGESRDHFFVKVERQKERAPPRKKPSRMRELLSKFGGFADKLKITNGTDSS
ncbi:hypothetical protein MOBT1_002564 [Malassezia obtusa]|uniref:RRM domain-containing protein n=1 Tax=Malassezia obtusa TaxID=76774 RepID=A0AAF0E698_9BASI|nr:hypothetical protein MOBT1_002564 [Malassezia obtusa]